MPGRHRPVSLTGKAAVYAAALRRAARAAVLNVGVDAVRQAFAGRALSVSILWTFPTDHPERLGHPHTFRPDKDNCEKLVLDCLQRAGALGGDDSRVALGLTQKIWGVQGTVAIRVEVVTRADVREVRKSIKNKLSAPPSWLG